ncbi:hypothetical protein F5I97DRAFT_800841 [Phlebopus sp. FC_14]|nr:hypothetical protein F5I97DRAFT_800841 [Phlebopus sp. FC_14]
MLKRRWFDGSHGEDGIGVLKDILEREQFRQAVLASNAVDRLLEMLQSGNNDTVYAGLHYLRIFSQFADGKAEMSRPDVVESALAALRIPRQAVQWSAIVILHILFNTSDVQKSMRIKGVTVASLRKSILDGLRNMLRSRKANEVLAVSMALRTLSADEEVQRKVVTDPGFWRLSHDYYNTLLLEYDKRGPCFGEVYESVGIMITSMQERESYHPVNDLARLTSAPYELSPKRGPSLSWLTT